MIAPGMTTQAKTDALMRQLEAFTPPDEPVVVSSGIGQAISMPTVAGPTITERHTLCWRQVLAYIDHRIGELHRLLETPGLPEARTEGLRGEVRALRQLASQGDDQPTIAQRNIYQT